MRSFMLAMLLVLLPAGGCAAAGTPAPPAAPDPTTDEQKTLYALGLVISRNLGAFSLTPEELALVQAGISDGVQGLPAKADLKTFGPKIQALARARVAAAVAAEQKAGQEFLAAAAAEPGAITTPSGLVYREITAGTGESPQATGKVRAHYTGRLRDGTVFDSSVERGQPEEMILSAVIPCWTEGILKMKVGGKSKISCPATSAYADRGLPPLVRPGAAVSYDVELLEIIK